MSETKKPDSKKPAEPVKLAPPAGPPRGHDDLVDVPLVDVSVPPRSPSASGFAAAAPSLNDVLKYWHLISEVLHAIQTEQADVKFRITAPSGKKKNVRILITDV